MSKSTTINLQHRAAHIGRPAVLLIVLVCLVKGMSPGAAFADIDNVATASGTYNAAPVFSNTDVANVPVTPSAPSLSVVKTASPSLNVPVGTVVTYTYEITNSGNATVAGVSLSDSHNGSGPAPVPGSETLSNDAGTPGDSTDIAPGDGVWSSLAPGDTVTFTATYTVTQNDVDTKQ